MSRPSRARKGEAPSLSRPSPSRSRPPWCLVRAPSWQRTSIQSRPARQRAHGPCAFVASFLPKRSSNLHKRMVLQSDQGSPRHGQPPSRARAVCVAALLTDRRIKPPFLRHDLRRFRIRFVVGRHDLHAVLVERVLDVRVQRVQDRSAPVAAARATPAACIARRSPAARSGRRPASVRGARPAVRSAAISSSASHLPPRRVVADRHRRRHVDALESANFE